MSAAAAKSKNDSFKEKEFTFSRVFQEDATQEDLYFVAAQPLVDALLVGKNGLLFTYGVSSAGKSYTMMGAGDGEAQGIVPRVLSVLLERAAAGATLALTCIEVHLENVWRKGTSHRIPNVLATLGWYTTHIRWKNVICQTQRVRNYFSRNSEKLCIGRLSGGQGSC